MLHHIMFPHLYPAKWAEVNFNQEAARFLYDTTPCCSIGAPAMPDDLDYVARKPLNFLTPKRQGELLYHVHQKLDIDCSYGGYLEDRSILWNGHYMAKDKMTHLGVDYNVPFGTEVMLPFDGRMVYAVNDKDQNGGWGRRVDYYNAKGDFYFILGHMMPIMQWFQLPMEFKKGTACGHVGHSAVNGGWFPHLHLQVMSAKEYHSFHDPMQIDGYGVNADDLSQRYLDPEKVV